MYGKVFDQIFDSSIAEDYLVRLVFEDLLVLCDQDGVVDKTPEAISRRTNVPIEIVRRGLIELEKPDPSSRSSLQDGRRIVRIDDHRDWGWVIVNYAHYRKLATEEQRRESNRQRVQRHRDKSSSALHALHPITKTLPYAYAYASSYGSSEEGSGGKLPTLTQEETIMDLALFRCLCRCFGRPEDKRWQYGDEACLKGLIRQGIVTKEGIALFERWFKAKIKHQGDSQYLPQSVETAISGWQKHIDRASVWDKEQKAYIPPERRVAKGSLSFT